MKISLIGEDNVIIRSRSIPLVLVQFLSLITLTNAVCNWYDEQYLGTCKSHEIVLNQHSQQLQIKSSRDFHKEFHSIKFDNNVKGKVLRLKWINFYFKSKDELTFKIG